MSGLTVVEARGEEALDMLRRDWQDLFRAAAAPSPFLSWEWIASWHRWLGRECTPRLFGARSGGRLVGLLPLGERERWGIRPRQVRSLSFLGESGVGGDYLDVLAARGFEHEAATAILEYLLRQASFEVLELNAVAGDSPSLPALAWHFGVDPHLTFRILPGDLCPYIRLEGGWPQVLARSRRPHRFKRLCRKLATYDGFELRSATAPDEVGPALERLLGLHHKRWSVQGGSDAMGRPAVQDFHREAVVRLAGAGLARIEELWLEGECRASYYGMQTGDRYYLYQTGYDPEWRNRSVAFARMGLSIQAAAERGLSVYDFLRGNETYKFDWANATRTTVRIQVARREAAAALLVARDQLRLAAKLALKAGLPAVGLELVRRGRRTWDRHSPSPSTQTEQEPPGSDNGRSAVESLAEAKQALP